MHNQAGQLPQEHQNETSELEHSTNSPSLIARQEKPSHYSYLKEFRVDPCPLFKQHQCTNHRPYSCFYWHFANQRRRRPVRRKDGTFNYSADFYCAKYDENTGVCPDGDDCPYLHRVYGDVERKYHLRYYKTAPCVHPSDAKGHCSKNGAHCAFAHGSDDIRNPIFDIRELQHCGELNSETVDNRDQLSFVVEDPIWQDQPYVLMNYKTEPCKKPPRLCRQGYACPYYHNGKDKRRLPQKQSMDNNSTNATGDTRQNGNGMVYRSTPCPNVKKGDEWGEPDMCEAGDNCPYCHTRTEQQFHPEIYKSTKCNDMLLHGYCPRGPFCAFAHSDAELHGERRHSTSSKRSSFSTGTNGSELGAALNAKLAVQTKQSKPANGSERDNRRRVSVTDGFTIPTPTVTPIRKNSLDMFSFDVRNNNQYEVATTNDGTSVPEKTLPSYSAVLKHHGSSGTAGSTPDSLEQSPPPANAIGYSKAPGFEREQHSPPRPWLATANTSSPSYDFFDDSYTEACKIKSNLYLHHDIGYDLSGAAVEQNQNGNGNGNGNGHSPTTPPTPSARHRNPSSPFNHFPWHHQENEDGRGGNFVSDESLLPPISEKDERRIDSSANLLELRASAAGNIVGSAPSATSYEEMVASRQSQHPPSTNGSEPLAMRSGSHRPRSSSLFAAPAEFQFGFRGLGGMNGVSAEAFLDQLRRTDEELSLIRCKLAAYEECAKRARQDCETWKKEALENKYRAQVAEQERAKAEQDRDRANAQFAMITNELKGLQTSGLWPLNTEILPQMQLEQIRARLLAELDKVERQLQHRSNGGPMCARCGRHVNESAVPGVCPLCSPNCKSTGPYQALAT